MESVDPTTLEIFIGAINQFGFWSFVGAALVLLVGYYAVTRILLPIFDVIGVAIAVKVRRLLN